MRLELPWPPTANTMFPTGKDGRRHLSKRGRSYRIEVYARVCEQTKRLKTLRGPLIVSVFLYPPDKRKRDIDNSFKALFDALTYSAVWEDDSQIKLLCAYVMPKKKGGGVFLHIEESELWPILT